MALIGQYKKKIKFAKNIAKITKAMQLIAASKMKKAQLSALSGKEYADGVHSMLLMISDKLAEDTHKLAKKNQSGKTLILVIAPEKGLCGGLVTNLSKYLTKIANDEKSPDFLVIGKKAKQIVARIFGSVIAGFDLGVSSPSYDLVPPIARIIEERFVGGQNNKVVVVYSDFVNTMEQETTIKVLLPLSIKDRLVRSDGISEFGSDYVFEPSVSEVANPLLEMYLEVEIYQLLLESFASEQSARMMAMKNATDNAKSLIEGLTVELNKVRQSTITNELLDIQNAVSIIS